MSQICPRCQQGELVHAVITNTSEPIIVCDECEATWLDGVPVAPTTFVDLVTYLRSKEIQGEWAALTVEST